jgi:hypothetical protein
MSVTLNINLNMASILQPFFKYILCLSVIQPDEFFFGKDELTSWCLFPLIRLIPPNPGSEINP